MLIKIFRSRDGQLALFWRLGCYLFLFLVIDVGAQIVRGLLASADAPSLAAELACAAISIPGILGLTYLFRTRRDKRSWRGMSLADLRKRWIEFASGGLWVFILMPAPLLYLALAVGQLRFVGTEAVDSGWTAGVEFALAGWVGAFGIGFIEELAFRGYVFQNLGERHPIWLAALVTGILFGLFHFFGGLSVARILDMAAFSTVFVVLRICTGSLWAAIGLHTTFNWVYTSLLGFSSGEGGYAHALLHFETPIGSEAAAPVNSWLGDISSIVPNLIAFGVVILALSVWKWGKKQPINWGTRLDGNGNPLLPSEMHAGGQTWGAGESSGSDGGT